MIIRRRTLRLALHQKSTTVTVQGSPASGPVSLVPAARFPEDETTAQMLELAAPAKPVAGNWLTRLLTTSRAKRSIFLLLLVFPTRLFAQRDCFRSPEAPPDFLRLVEAMGNSTVVDTGNGRVYEDVARPRGYTEFFVGGGFAYPDAVAVDQEGNLYAGDESNQRVGKISVSGAQSLSFPSTVVGATSAYQLIAFANIAINTSGSMSNYSSAGVASPTSIAINPR